MLSRTDITVPLPEGDIGCYLSEQSRGRPGIILLQEIFGVNPHIRGLADRLAEAGYCVLAPDIFHSIQPNTQLNYDDAGFTQGFQLLNQLDRDQTVADIGHCIEFLTQRGSSKVAVFGFCLGGCLAFLSAARLSPAAAVAYYPGGIGRYTDESAAIACPLLIHFAQSDEFVPPKHAERTRLATQHLSDCQIETYEAEHGFNCDERSHYDANAAELAWQRSLAFLKHHLS